MLKNARQADTGVKLEVNERYEGVLFMIVVALSSGPPRRRGNFALGPGATTLSE